MSKRRKAAPVDVPQTEVEARHLAASYASMVGEIEAIEAERKIRIAEVNRDCDARIGQRAPLLDGMFARLKGWWEAHGERIAGKRRSAEFAGLTVGYRLTPSALKLPKGKTVKEVTDCILDWLGGDFVVTKHELDRRAIVAHLQKPIEDLDDIDTHQRNALIDAGLSVGQRNEFFVDVLPKGDEP